MHNPHVRTGFQDHVEISHGFSVQFPLLQVFFAQRQHFLDFGNVFPELFLFQQQELHQHIQVPGIQGFGFFQAF